MIPYNIHKPPRVVAGWQPRLLYYLAILVVAILAGFWALALLSLRCVAGRRSPCHFAPVPAPDALLGALLIAVVSGAVALVALIWFPDDDVGVAAADDLVVDETHEGSQS